MINRIGMILLISGALVLLPGCTGTKEKEQAASKTQPALVRDNLENGGDNRNKMAADNIPADAEAPPAAENGAYMKPAEASLRQRLTQTQYIVTQENGTELPFINEYWDNHEQGIYVDIVSGEPLFSSRDKFDSDTGWPSFTTPLAPGNVVALKDASYGMIRIEVRSRFADSHLGHVFDDGPAPAGLRYCINSAALRFIPVKNLEQEGYGKYLTDFAM